MAKREQFVTDEQWAKIEPLLPKREVSKRGGRPAVSDRECLEGILWVLRSGARWKDLPDWYPSYPTCWRRLVYWEGEDVLVAIWHAFLDELDEKGLINWEQIFVDASFSPAKKRGDDVGPTKRGKGTKWLGAEDRKGVPLACRTASGRTAEVKVARQSSPNSKARKTVPSRSSRTEPTTAMRFQQNFVRKALSSAVRIDVGGKGRRPKTDES